MRLNPDALQASNSNAYAGEGVALPATGGTAVEGLPQRGLSSWGHPRRSPLPFAIFSLKLADIAAALALGIVVAGEYASIPGSVVGFREALLLLMLGAVVYLQALRNGGQYEMAELAQGRRIFRPLVMATFLGATALGVVGIAVGEPLTLLAVAYFWLGSVALAGLASRGVLSWYVARWRASDSLATRILVVGATEVGERVIRAAQQSGNGSVKIVGVYDDRKDRLPPEVLGCPILGTTKDLLSSRLVDQVDRIIIALPWSADARILSILQTLRNASPDIALAPDLAGYLCQDGSELEPASLIKRPVCGRYWLTKAIEDRVLGVLMMLAASPAMLVIAALIKLDSPGPVFFAQPRFGVHNRIISVLKFRTMRHETRDTMATRQTTADDERVTRVGRFLRRYSLDELPQLINVIRGEMSVIGPRPYALRMNVGSRYAKDILLEYALRRHVKPGITGWAQVNGHSGPVHEEAQFAARLRHDLHYVENWSLALDLRILLRTFGVVFGGRTNA
ncbi:MAG: exopolysaccharide biosynthesis polyprenyl glycosylphosphotransferase [Rhodospirillaceae bacterium]|nr:exopolysaccharide biosynthesis polyprenyl glycosylphosphotransferase [Rhodospirillaceae bacterium]